VEKENPSLPGRSYQHSSYRDHHHHHHHHHHPPLRFFLPPLALFTAQGQQSWSGGWERWESTPPIAAAYDQASPIINNILGPYRHDDGIASGHYYFSHYRMAGVSEDKRVEQDEAYH